MPRHPLHPISVHAPLTCIVLTPLADLAALGSGNAQFWFVAAWSAIAATVAGLLAATFGAMDFAKAYAKAPKTVAWHAGAMMAAVTLTLASLAGRLAQDLSVRPEPSDWAMWLSAAALACVIIGGALGGELVYGHGIGVAKKD